MMWLHKVEGLVDGSLPPLSPAEAWYANASRAKRKHALHVMFPRTFRLFNADQFGDLIAALGCDATSYDWFMNHELILDKLRSWDAPAEVIDLAEHEATLAELSRVRTPLAWETPLNPTLTIAMRLATSLQNQAVEADPNSNPVPVAYWLRGDGRTRFRQVTPAELALLRIALEAIPLAEAAEESGVDAASIEQGLLTLVELEMIRWTPPCNTCSDQENVSEEQSADASDLSICRTP